jgi:hypothetical protein
MAQLAGLRILALGAALLCGRVGLADDIVTDANIVTGLDISDSVDSDNMRLEIEGMARAIHSPEVLAAIQSGQTGRIGFAVFAWHHNQFPKVVSWSLIASEADAIVVAREIEARLHVNVELEAREKEAFYIGRLTDVSQAIDHAAEMLATAPFTTEHNIANIVGNGDDNVGEDARFARDRMVEMGAIVNGVVLGGDPSVLDYYRRQVVGGPGAFLMSADDAPTLVDVMRRKLVHDIVLAMPPRDRVATTVIRQ